MWVIHLQLSLITKNCSPILPCIASISCWLCLLYFTQSIPYEAVRGRRGGGWGEGEGKRNKQSDPWTMNIGLVRGMHSPEIGTIDNGNRTKWSLIRSVIIWVINKIGQLQSRGLICLSLLWLQTELDNKKSCYQLIITISISEKTNTPRTNTSHGDHVFC